MKKGNDFKYSEAKILQKFPFVKWDRFVEVDLFTKIFYGWIDREDSYKDFLVLTLSFGKPDNFVTSSEKHSLKISKILGFETDDHKECQRVEKHYNIKNSIKIL